ncbi:Transposon Ty3-G Gag-Pol polyprotein [Labeo rohita]|uniref:ribonuclease H n=1 Tax=Labeo rohita TaxID=84645 RepID=A0ABQ8MSW0_LABRO|nr:Transposon Ty3-G Gag-Pol polyprotein [Labeo rohita]
MRPSLVGERSWTRESAPGRGVPSSSSPILAGPSMVLGPDFPPRRLSLVDDLQERSPLTGRGFHSSPPAGAVEALGVASEGAHLLASGLSTEVVETILQSRAPSMRKLYALKWRLCVKEIGVVPSVGLISIYQLPVPHHPRWRSGEGVYGAPTGSHLADGHHVVNKRAISFFSGRHSPSIRRSEAGNPLLSTNPPGKAASALRGFSPPATRYFPSHGAPILGTSDVTPLRPLAENFSDWLSLPNPSHWFLRTIGLGYAIQFASRPPKFCGVLAASVLRAEIAVLLAVCSPQFAVPSAKMKKGFYSPYFIVPKKGGGLRPILDLRVLNRALLKLSFKMLILKHILTCVRAQDWFVATDLKDTYFLVLILPRHRPFLQFAFEGRVYQYKVLPFGLSLSPCVFTKVAEAALAPLREVGFRILNYLDNWIILAHSWDLVCAHMDLVLNHLAQLGLWVNWEKSKLSPVQRISFLGVELDSVSMSARFSPECAQSVLRCAATLRCGSTVHLKQVQRLLGHMASSATVMPLGVPLEQMSRHIIGTTDASKTGWGAVCNGQAASGVWTGPQLHWHINCLELLAVLLALRRFRPLIQGKHVLVRSDNTATVAYINHQGGVCSFRMSKLAHHLLLWSQHRLKSLRVTHIPGFARRRVEAPPPVGSADLGLIQPGTSRSLCLTGIHPLPVVVREPHCTDSVQSQGGQGTDFLGGPVLAQQNLFFGPGAPGISPSLAHSSEEGPPLSGEGHNLPPAPRSLEPPPMVPGHDQEDFRDLSPSVVNTLLQARAPSTRRLDQVVTLQAISSQEDDPNLTLLCPVRALCIYMERTQPFRRFEQVFVCYGGQLKGKAVSKQRISHWLVDATRTAYQARGLPCPLGV